ncbi:MAG: SRPBCC domain-containing protein [Candidatus Peribacteraceae bacterium]|nr:SRPBCC domain-containing protein [Candidatus Peribacteraceae bacterium]
MQKIHLTTFIKAPRAKVWDTMLSDATYRDWTSAFCPGSYYKGNWEEGSKILFLGPDPTGANKGVGGMVSRIKKNKLHEFVSIEHLGLVRDGVEDTTSEATKGWAGAHENYTFNEKDGGTELVIDLDIMEEEKANMEAMWKKALLRLKELVEG